MKLTRYSLSSLLFSSHRERCILFSQHKLKRKSDVSFNTVFVLINALFSDAFARLQFYTSYYFDCTLKTLILFFFTSTSRRCSLRIILTLFERIIFEFQWFFFDVWSYDVNERLRATKFLHFSREFKFGLNSMEKCWFRLQQVVQGNMRVSLYFDRESNKEEETWEDGASVLPNWKKNSRVRSD